LCRRAGRGCNAAPTTRIAAINRREIDAGRDDMAAAVLNTTSCAVMKTGASDNPSFTEVGSTSWTTSGVAADIFGDCDISPPRRIDLPPSLEMLC
jgi:hypothetical protein